MWYELLLGEALGGLEVAVYKVGAGTASWDRGPVELAPHYGPAGMGAGPQRKGQGHVVGHIGTLWRLALIMRILGPEAAHVSHALHIVPPEEPLGGWRMPYIRWEPKRLLGTGGPLSWPLMLGRLAWAPGPRGRAKAMLVAP